MRSLLAVVILLGTVLAGCASSGPPAAAPEPTPRFTSPDDPIPEDTGGDHDHRDPLQHLFARNASLLDHDDLRRFGWTEEVPVGAHALAIHGVLLAVAVNAVHRDGQHGVHLFDVSDPANMTHLSFWEAQVRVNGDRTVAFSGDGQTLFLGFEGGGGAPGVQALDIRDPARPLPAGFWSDPQGYGSHTIAAGVIDGVQHVFSLAMGVNILRYDGASFTLVGKYMTQDQLAIADAVDYVIGEQQGSPQTYALRSLYGHDMNFYADAATGLPLLLVAYAYDGAKILDLSVPSAPVLIGRFLPPEDTDHKHYTHSITAERLESGELIVVVGSETFEPANQQIASPIWILDATETVTAPPLTAQPIHQGTWRNPGGAAAGLLGLSVHFFRQEAGFVYISHYHGGVWALDARTSEARAAPEAFGYIMPVPEDAIAPPEDCCIGFDLDGVPMVFDVEVKDGVVYAADIIQGVTSLRFVRPG